MGYCGIEWYPSTRTSPDSFGLLHAALADTAIHTIETCVSSYVNIPGALNYPITTAPAVLHALYPNINNICGEGWTRTRWLGTWARSDHSKHHSALTCSLTAARRRCWPAPPPLWPAGLRWCTGSSPAASAHKMSHG